MEFAAELEVAGVVGLQDKDRTPEQRALPVLKKKENQEYELVGEFANEEDQSFR